MQIQPTQYYISVKLRSIPSESGIILPDNVSPLNPHAEVIAIGPDCTRCKVGDLVFFLPGNAVTGFNEGKPDECVILPETAVFAKYVPDAMDGVLTLPQRN